MAKIFSPRVDIYWKQIVLAVILKVGLFWSVLYYYALPSYTRVGFSPDQPVPFSHALHVGQIGMNCQYCHTAVADSPHSNVPSAATCFTCHSAIKKDSLLLSQVRESWEGGNPVPWKRIHKLPEYAYFNHAVHVNRGVSCVSCHGPMNQMGATGYDWPAASSSAPDAAVKFPIHHNQILSMGWCLNCHRAPTENVRPAEEVFNMTWQPEKGKTREEVGQEQVKKYNLNPPQTCQGCHR